MAMVLSRRCLLTHGNMGPKADFFGRNRLPPETKALCWDFVQTNLKRPEAAIREAPLQGHCSYTLYLDQDSIVQFRSQKHQIDLDIATLARDVFCDLAPSTQLLGPVLIPGDQPPFLAYHISRIPGKPLSSLCHETVHRESLVLGFAHLVNTAWVSAFSPTSSDLEPLKRRIGRSLRPRLTKLSTSLPLRFRPIAAKALAFLPEIESLPWVLTHGDLVPSNIMISPSPEPSELPEPPKMTLTGLLDWAESEPLPFGILLYGLEELLGRSVGVGGIPNPDPHGGQYPPRGSVFEYLGEAEALRELFWGELKGLVPLLKDVEFRERVEWARVAGILLWHGFAWDDGKLDRVVEEGKDDEEVQRLDVMLLGRDAPGRLEGLSN